MRKDGLLIREFSAADIDADPARIGFPGSPTKVKSVMSVVLTASEAKSVPATDEGIGLLIHELISDHTPGVSIIMAEKIGNVWIFIEPKAEKPPM